MASAAAVVSAGGAGSGQERPAQVVTNVTPGGTTAAPKSPAYPVLWAIAGALIVWLVNHFVILQFVNPVMARDFPYWLFALSHVMYGIGLGGFLAWRRRQAAPTAASATGTYATRTARAA